MRAAPRRLRFVLLLLALLVPGGAALVSRAAPVQGPKTPQERRLTIFYTAEVRGVLEPCGCTSDPLGDVARYAELVRAAKRDGAILLLDGGALSYPESSTAKEKAAEPLRAKFLAETLEKLGPFAAGLDEPDVRVGPTSVIPRRLAVNLGPSAAVGTSRIDTLGGIRVGIFGVADPAIAAKLGVKAEDPVAASRREVERLRREGAELVIALAPLDRPIARRVGREAGPDLVIQGRQVGKGQARAERAGQSFIFAPADELQRVGRIDLVWRSGGPLVDAGGPEAAALRRVEIDNTIARLDDQLKSWTNSSNGGGDPGFIAAKRKEREALLAERKALDAEWKAPSSGSYFTHRLIPLRRSLPRNAQVAAGMRQLDTKIAAVNLKVAEPPPPAEPGRAHYVGDRKCVSCHKSAFAFWKKTVHASAWETLVRDKKQHDFRCVSCHVTGYGQVGGSSLGHTKRLEDVQCETCHGPGSIHVAEEGLEEPLAVRRDTPESTCTACHNEQHSDTFQYQAYLRDILGPGHGAQARAKLGNGPTGHELRSTALARAKAAGKAQLDKVH
jgi:hypothetical protein